ncbi:MAG TPA: carboxypeptidase regulatory-like domain-containing protein [Acidobacteriaceae bacterium]|nr:carboxypeptidase regulatory-like domain-containing protein [Acidobacteriaceae bacterium]
MRRLRQLLILPVCILFTWPLVCFPQATEVDEITGTIQDTSGAAVPNAEVKVIQTDTGFTRTATSGSDGSYILSNLPIGPYRFEASASGFKTYIQNGIVLQVNINPTINARLEIGAVTQQVEVQASASMAETETADVAQVINSKSVVDLPLNGRQPTQLILLSGASTTINGFVGSKNYPSSVTISIAGGVTNGTNYLMDGGYHNDVFSAVNLPLPFPDVLQEFSVQTSSIPASYGERAGGVVNIVTKSGTNALHGDLFEFLRNGAVNARNYFATKVDQQKRNQFGGTLGGPIKHDKLFFFGGFQRTILRTAPPTTISFTPTAQELQGDFSAISKPIINPATGTPFPGNQIPTSDFNTSSLNLLKYIPVGSAPLGEVVYSIPSPSTENQALGRIDWTQSPRDSIFGRYYYAKDSNPAAFGGDLLLTTQAGVIDTVQALTAGDTFTLSPNAVNALHFTWTYERINRGPAAGIPPASTLGISVAPSPGNSPQIGVSNYFSTMCGTCSIATVYSGAKQVADDFNLVKGRQQFSFGADWVGKYLNYTTSSQQNIAVTFNGSVTGNSLSDLLLGYPSDFQQGNITKWDPVMNYFGFYASDRIKLNPRLSFTAGLRWEPYLPQYDTQKRASHFDQAAFTAGAKTKVYVNAPAGLTFPGDPGFPTGGTSHSLAQFAPRLALVWDVFGNANTIVHVGYGILNDGRSDLETFDRFGFEPPWASLIDLANPAGGFSNPYQGYPGGDPFPLPIPPTANATFTSEAQYVNLPLHIKPTYFQAWNASVQQQFGRNWLFSIDYIGNQGTHLWVNYQADPAVYIPGKCGATNCSTVANTNSRRILSQLDPVNGSGFSSLSTINDGETSSYHSMLVSLNRRLENNLSLLMNYTWSHCINEGDADPEITGSYQNPYDLAAERGNCASDVRQIYNISLVASMPRLSGNFVKRQLISDWRLSAIVSGHSGSFFTPVTGQDSSLTGVNADRPNVQGNPNEFNRTLKKWFNTSEYSTNPPGTYGNAGRNSLLGPGGYEPDLAVFRDFPFQVFDRPQYFELRLEAFNAFNHPEFSNPTSTSTSAQFGQILGTANNARIMQISGKFVF